MSKGGNASNAYATVRPVAISLVDTFTKQEDQNFKYRREQREIDFIEDQRKERELAKKEALTKEMLAKIPQNYNSGSESLNELNGRIISQATNRIGEITQKLASPKLSEEEKIKLRIEAQQLNNLPENLKLAHDAFTNKISEYKQGVASGSLFQDPNFEKQVLSGFQNYIGGLDNGLPVIGFADRNGDGVIDKLDLVTYNDIQSGIPQFSFQPKVDFDKIIQTAAPTIGLDDITTEKGYTSKQVKEASDKNITARAQSLIYENPTSKIPNTAALSQLRVLGMDPTPENLQFLENYTKEQLETRISTLKKDDTDWGAMNASQRLAFDKEKAEKEKVEFIQVETPPIYNEFKIQPASGYKTVSVRGGKPIPYIQGVDPKDNKKKVEITNGTISSFTVVRLPNGQRAVAAEIISQDSKGSVLSAQEEEQLNDSNTSSEQKELLLSKVNKGATNKATMMYLTEKDGAKYAKDLGVDYNEFKDAARASKETESATGILD